MRDCVVVGDDDDDGGDGDAWSFAQVNVSTYEPDVTSDVSSYGGGINDMSGASLGPYSTAPVCQPEPKCASSFLRLVSNSLMQSSPSQCLFRSRAGEHRRQ